MKTQAQLTKVFQDARTPALLTSGKNLHVRQADKLLGQAALLISKANTELYLGGQIKGKLIR